MGDVERVADFVEAVGLAVVGKLPADLQPRGVKEVAQGVFVFVAVQPALRRPAFADDGRALVSGQRGVEAADEGGEFTRRGALFVLGWHLAVGEPVVDLDPRLKRRRIARSELQAGEIQARLVVDVVVTLRAVGFDQGVRAAGQIRFRGREAECAEGERQAEWQRAYPSAAAVAGAWAFHANSRPRIVPVDEANLSSSSPIRCSIETKRFGSG